MMHEPQLRLPSTLMDALVVKLVFVSICVVGVGILILMMRWLTIISSLTVFQVKLLVNILLKDWMVGTLVLWWKGIAFPLVWMVRVSLLVRLGMTLLVTLVFLTCAPPRLLKMVVVRLLNLVVLDLVARWCANRPLVKWGCLFLVIAK